MDGDRKYRQHGYQDSGHSSSNGHRSERPRPQGPKPALDITGPKLPRLVQNVVASRCFNCAVALPADVDWKGACPKCRASLHCCKQCVHFEPATRFQCLKPIPVRLSGKDQVNECTLFSPRFTVARDGMDPGPASFGRNTASGSGTRTGLDTPAPRSASDARAAFDSLFKK